MSPFHRLWVAAGLSNLGDGVGMIAVPLVAATLTRDPALVGGLAGTLFLPHLILGVPAGALVDRVERRTAMVAANVVRAAALAGVCAGLAGGLVTIAWLFVLVFVLGACECVYDAAADGAVPLLAEPCGLDGANARLQGTVTVANNFLGAPVGAVLFSVAAVAPFGLYAVCVVAATLLVASLPRMSARRAAHGRCGGTTSSSGGDSRPRASGRALLAEVREGLVWLLRQPGLRALAGVSAGLAFAGQLAQATLVLFVLEVLHLPAEAFGVVAMTAAAGAVVGAVAAPSLGRRFGRLPVMLAVGAAEGVAVLAVGLAPGAVVAGLAFAAFGAGVGTWNVLSMSLRQELVPPELFGRVHGAWRTLVWGALPLGAWLGGALASTVGLRAPWVVSAVLHVVVLAVGVRALRRTALLAPQARSGVAVPAA